MTQFTFPTLRVAAAICALAAGTSVAFAQSSFEEGSFGDNAGSGSAAQSPSGQGAGGFDESSFDTSPGGTQAPAQTQPSGSGGGFDESSFEPGGGGDQPANVAQDDSTTGGGSVGGDDFPGSNVSPETDGGGSVAGTDDPGSGEQGTTPQVPGIDPQITAFETRDFGVPPQNSLRQGQFHAPTPVAVPGANLVTTDALVTAINQGMQILFIDVLGQGYSLPGALNAPALASAGSFNDRTQQQANAWLQQITNGTRDTPIVIFCSDPMCWLSYNAALRTVASGQTNVYWYRGGLQAWQMAGLPMQPVGF